MLSALMAYPEGLPGLDNGDGYGSLAAPGRRVGGGWPAGKGRERGCVVGKIFITYAGSDGATARDVAEKLRVAGYLDIFLDTDPGGGIPPAMEWQKTLFLQLRACEAVVFLNSPRARVSCWCHTELAVSHDSRKRVYSVDLAEAQVPHPLNAGVQGIKFVTDLDDSIKRLTHALRSDGLTQGPRFEIDRARGPYPGLEKMEEGDAGVFFGREKNLQELMDRVKTPLNPPGGNLVIVTGQSGAGKSSLVRAGLVARLRQTDWLVTDPLTPFSKPLDALAEQLAAVAPVNGVNAAKVRERLTRDGICGAGEWLLGRVGRERMLVTIDQAELLLTNTAPTESRKFFDVLKRGLDRLSPVTVVMTVRGDYYDALIKWVPEPELTAGPPFYLHPMGRAELTEAIEGPARRFSLDIEENLARGILDDPDAYSRDSLPFLAFALRQMYELGKTREPPGFAFKDYQDVGGVVGALERQIREAEKRIPQDKRDGLEGLLRELVTVKDAQPTSRLAPRDPPGRNKKQKMEGQRLETRRGIIGILVESRLLTVEDSSVRLAHDKLISAWPLLAETLKKNRSDLELGAQLAEQAARWKAGPGPLLKPGDIEGAEEWLKRQAAFGSVNDDIKKYVNVSRSARRRQRAFRNVVIALVLVFAIFAVTGFFVAIGQRAVALNQTRIAAGQRAVALSQSRIAQSEEMAAEATTLFPTNVPLAMLLSVQAYERDPTAQAGDVLTEAADEPFAYLLDQGSPDNKVAISPDGRTLAAGSDDDGTISLWDTATREQKGTLNEGSLVRDVVFSPSGQLLAVGDDSGDVLLWDVATRQRIATLAAGNPVGSVAFTADGQLLAVGDDSGAVAVWNVAAKQRTATLDAGSDPVDSVAFSPDGQLLAAGDNGVATLWNVATRQRIVSLNSGASVAFSPNGQLLAVGSFAGRVSLWNVATQRVTSTLNEGDVVNAVAFSPDGQTLAAASGNGDVGLWNITTGQQTATLAEGSDVGSVSFGPDGKTLAVGSDGGVGVWETGTGQRANVLNTGSDVGGVAFSPDGRTLAVGGLNGDIGLWGVTGNQQTVTLPGNSPVQYVTFSPGGQTLAAGDVNGRVYLWNLATGQPTRILVAPGPINSLAFSPDGKTLAVGTGTGPDGGGGGVSLVNIASDKVTGVVADGTIVFTVAFSPNGQLLAAGGSHAGFGLVDLATGKSVISADPGESVASVAFSPGGHTLAVGDSSGNVILWNTATLKRVSTLPEVSSISRVAFSPSGQTLAVAVDDTVQLLPQSPTGSRGNALENLVCGEVRGNLTPAQWAGYAPGQPYQKTCPSSP